MFRHSMPQQCSLVHIHICGCILFIDYFYIYIFIHVNLLSPSARGTTQHNPHMWTCAEQSVTVPECSNDLKGSGLCIIAFRHLLRSGRVLSAHPHMWLHCIYTRELALTKRTWYNTTQPTHVDMRRASQCQGVQTTSREVGFAL